MTYWPSVVVATPSHSTVGETLSYTHAEALLPGTLVRVPLGTREVLGVVWECPTQRPAQLGAAQAKPVTGALDGLPPLNGAWRQLVRFAAQYYQRSLGEVALAALPPQLRELDAAQLARRLKRRAAHQAVSAHAAREVQVPTAPDTAAQAGQTQRPGQPTSAGTAPPEGHPLSDEQHETLQALGSASAPVLLFGATGSGKTEVYLRATQAALERAVPAGRCQPQVLVMVPEINLTPQLERRFLERFEPVYGDGSVVCLHSGMTPAQRLSAWLGAHTGAARIVLGTRMAIFASLPGLRLIVVDEEHDPSYKSQDGARYSARDLAVYRAKVESDALAADELPPETTGGDGAANRLNGADAGGNGPFTGGNGEGASGNGEGASGNGEGASGNGEGASGNGEGASGDGAAAGGDAAAVSSDGAAHSARSAAGRSAPTVPGCQVVLGSATPSLESWHAAEQGRYRRLAMPGRIGGGALPRLRLVDMAQQPKGAVIAPPLLAAMGERIARGEQCLVLLNRRGYAPVLACHDCGWKSGCPHCSAYRVFHKLDRTLRCHHCGYTDRVPRACPDCGNLDIAPVGRGTEQLEEQLTGLLAGVLRPDGQPARVARMDADSTRLKGSLEAQLAALHSGEVDVLVGTQMIAKGHDFRRITLVASINADAALFASDYRAPERLFALLMQAAGRAGRDAAFSRAQGSESEMWVQTWYPAHPLLATLRRYDYPAFAASELAERAAAGMPPHGFQALLRADARSQPAAQAFLTLAAAEAAGLPNREHITLYPAVPLAVQRVANVERAQLLVESRSRGALQRFLAAWQPVLHRCRSAPEAKGLVRWAVDVDPLVV